MQPCLFFISLLRSIRKNRRHCTLVSCVLIIGSLLSSIVLAGTTETNYQYDDLGRVKTVEYVNTASHTYTYDAADNRTGKQVVLTPDTTPPSQPGTILFSNITATSATATWVAATDDRGAIDSYEYSYNNADPWVSVGTALTVTLTGRAPNTTYNLYVRAKDAAKNPGLSRSGNFKTLTDTLPPVISGVLSCPSVTSTSLTVTWWAASDNVAVTDYEYSYNNKINWFSAGLVTTKTISGLAPSTLYTVYVHAKDAAGNISSDISGMCTTAGDTTLPGQSGVPNISNITNTSATATWTAATDDIGVTGYEYKLDSGSWVSVGPALTVNLTGLTRNTNYTFYVRAKDAAGNYTFIPSSKPFTTTNIDTQPPSAPGTPSFSNITNTSATATWAAATDDFGVTGYEYKVDSGSWVSVGLALTTNLSGLTANTTYTVYVRAKDAAGNYTLVPSSNPLPTSNIDTQPPTTPGTPSFSNKTNTSATATWAAATDNVGVTGYDYKVDNGSWVSVGLALTANLPGLTANTPYTVYVRAKDAAGNYSTTPSSNGFSTLNLIGVPGTPSFSSIGVNSASASWTAATGNVASYELSTNSGSTWTNVGNTLTTTISSLSAGSTYSVMIRGRSTSDVPGQSSSPGSVTTLNGNPGTPVVTNITTTTATLTWAASSGTVSSYQYSINSGATWTNVGNVLSVDLSGLATGTTYTFHLQPKNTAGAVGPGAQKDFTTLVPIGIPGTPVSSNITQTSAAITWSAASGPVASYEYSKDGGSNWVNVGNTLSASITGLNAGTTYVVLVRAKNSSGVPGSATPPINVTTLNGNPGTPVASNITTTTATLTWTASSGTVSSYQYSINSGATWTNVGNVLSVNLTGLTAGVTYTFHLQPKNTAGAVGPAAQPTNFTTESIDTQPPTQPGSVYVPDMSYPTAQATWTAASDNVGVVRYEYTIDGGSTWVNVGNVLSTTLSGLVAGQDYTFSVRAFDAANNPSLSGSDGFSTRDVVAPTTPGIPVISNLTMTSFSATWSASTDNVGVHSYWYSLDGGITNVNVGLSLSANISGLTPNRYQTIYVFAKDAAGNPSVASSKGFKTYPYPPTSAYVDTITATTATAHWSFPSDAQYTSGYEYSLDGSSWTFVGSATNQVALSGLAPSTTYTFRVRTKDAEGQLSSEASSQFTTSAAASAVISISDTTVSVVSTIAPYSLLSSGAISSGGYWITPQVGMQSFEARGTVLSGSCQGTTGSWLPLGSSNVAWAAYIYMGSSGYVQTCRFKLEIRHVNNPSVILDSATITLQATKP